MSTTTRAHPLPFGRLPTFSHSFRDHAPPPDDLHEQVERVKKIQREKPVTDVMKGAIVKVLMFLLI